MQVGKRLPGLGTGCRVRCVCFDGATPLPLNPLYASSLPTLSAQASDTPDALPGRL